MATATAHGPKSGRVHKLTRCLADARERASMARSYGDEAGARYLTAEVRRLSRILAEGSAR
jgi:hypothetical protein